ncbi:hypothetical protein OKW47_003477 [Paraburkholderia atlantica]
MATENRPIYTVGDSKGGGSDAYPRAGALARAVRCHVLESHQRRADTP